MTLEFTEIGTSGQYEANATVNADFNVRVDMVKSGMVVISLTMYDDLKPVIKDVASVGEDGSFEQTYVDKGYPKVVIIKTTSLPRLGRISEVE